MAIVLALIGSLVFGASDFIGGVVSRRVPPLRVAALAQAVALVLAVPTALLYGRNDVGGADVALSLASGLAAAVGLGLFYTGMARGLISLVVPVTAVVTTVIPVAWGYGTGERPGTAATVGIALAIASIAVVSAVPTTHGPRGRTAAYVFALSASSGVCFGAFIVLIAGTGEDAGLWPVLLSRTTSALGLALLALVFTGRRADGIGAALPACSAIGVLEAGGVVALLLALQRGPLAIASVLLALYPVGTVLLAVAFLHERLTRHQVAGVALALCSVVLISI